MFVFCALILVAGVVYKAEAIDNCLSYPEGYCVLEGPATSICPHYERWRFDWDSKTCERIYWSQHCGWPVEDFNMFATSQKCHADCVGWS